MKKLKIYFLAVLAACGIFVSVSAIPPMPPGPPDPVIDVADDAVYYLNLATNVVNNATTQMNVVVQTMNLQATSLLSKFVGKFQGFMGGIFKKKQELPGTKKIEESTVADIYDPVSVQKAMYPMFFEYPADCDDTSDPENAKNCEYYKQMRSEFYEDTVIEIYTAVRELEKKFPEIEESIASLETSLAAGEKGAENPENGKNAIIKNLYNTYDTLNSILKIIEEIEAMKAQYFAAQAIGSNTVRPQKPVKKDKGALNDVFMPLDAKNITIKVASKETFRFADSADDKRKLTYPSHFTFVNTPDMGTEKPFSGSAEDIALMEKLGEAQEKIGDIIEIHNKIGMLDALQSTYDHYNKQKRLHEKSIEALKATEKCAINYYKAMYENPQQVWNGGLPESMVTSHEQRKGISGWAFKAYSLAKAEDSGIINDVSENMSSSASKASKDENGKVKVEASDFSEVQIDTSNVDVRDLSSSTTSLSSKVNENTSSSIKDAEKEKKIMTAMNESQRIPWNIASEMAHMLAEDQYKNGKKGKWGNAKMLYPVWKDTKSYYDQYLDGKYEGISKRLDLFNTNNLALEIAEKLNNLSGDENKTKNAETIRQLKSMIAKESEVSGADLDSIVAEKKQKLDQLYQAKEAQLAAIDKKEKEITKELNNIVKELDALSKEQQKAVQENKKAETAVSAMESLIDTLYKYEIDKDVQTYIETEEKEYKKELNGNILEQQSNLYQGLYQSREHLGYAQLALQSSMDDEGALEKDTEVKTYTKQVQTEKEIEDDEPLSLLVAKDTLAKNRKLSLELEQKIINLNQQIKEKEDKKAALKKIIDVDLRNQRDAVKEQYVLAANEVTQSYDKRLLDAENKYQEEIKKTNNINLASYYKDKFKIPTSGIVGQVYQSSLLDILNDANELVEDAKGTARELIKETRQQMADMGENLYNQDNHRKVVDLHKQLIEKLKDLPEQNLKNFGAKANAYASYSGIIKLLRSIYAKYIVEDACVNNYCYEPDKEYFVSVSGKRRDFLAPKVVPQSTLASVRETVYFDVNDYDIIPKSKTGVVSPRDILNNLSYVPDIWKKILASPAYGEKDIDFAELLSPSAESSEKAQRLLANSGLYPCMYNNYVVTSDGEKYVIYSKTPVTGLFGFASSSNAAADNQAYEKLKKKGYAQCQDILITGTGLYLNVKNISEDVSGEAQVKGYSSFPFEDDEDNENEENQDKVKMSEVSELSYLFKYDNGLKYNDVAGRALQELSNANKNTNTEMRQAFALYDQLTLSHSQTGAFLEALDQEQSLAEGVLEAKIEIETAKQNLKELFDKIGFVISADFDLSKESDYNLARNKILKYRDDSIKAVSSAIAPAQSSKNDIIQSRLKKINNILAALKKDSQAYTTIGESSADNAELEQNIRTEMTNRKVIAEQKKKADEDFEKHLNKTGKIYCYQLIDNM
ncbi:MAG: hypothetical protein IJ545_00600 [Alphaproteobacteria bacterium]|nr:hypothetical protein [Alphaproteobacteria bacterium]